MSECTICKTKEDLLSSMPLCIYCLDETLDKRLEKKAVSKRKQKAAYCERGRKAIWTDHAGRFDDKSGINHRGAYPLYDGVAR